MNKRLLIIQISILIVGSALFLPGLGNVRLFDWDEINFAESAREMLVSGDLLNVQINFESFWEKPPLFIWMQALSMKVFGVGEFAARFPNAIAGIITLLVLFNIGRKTKDEKFGLLWTILYAASFFPFFYFKSGIIDPWFNLFIFLGIYFFSRYADKQERRNLMLSAALSAMFIGLGILTKGPVALLIFVLTFIVYLAWNKFHFSFRWKDVAVYIAVLCVVGGAWFILQIASGHYSIIQDFIQYQIRLFETKDAGHGGFLLYHFVILFFGVFPASILALPVFRRRILLRENNQRLADMFRWMMISFWVVLILFTIVRTKIIHYSSFCYFPLTFLAAYSVYYMLEGKIAFKGYIKTLLIIIASLFGIAITAVTLFDKIKVHLYPFVSDPYTLNSMKATSQWVGYEPLIGIVLIICTVVFCVRFGKMRSMKNLSILLIGSVFFIFTTMLSVVGEVEKYSQAPAVDFYLSKKGEECYIYPREKSYAHYFYSDRRPQNTCDDFDYLSKGDIDRPCYFVIKNDPKKIEEFISKIDGASFMYEENGFVFYVRMPK
jgi:4-amino-4-deoxy-L-arabinose transferase-like glycosyltransferase